VEVLMLFISAAVGAIVFEAQAEAATPQHIASVSAILTLVVVLAAVLYAAWKKSREETRGDR
jgi:uncharacterized membrane protein